MLTLVFVPIVTRNPLNGGTGHSRLAGILRSKERKRQRQTVAYVLGAYSLPSMPVMVTLTRVAPSSGLDSHDGLRAALKGCVDGVADVYQRADRDEGFTWIYGQERGRPRQYGVRIRIEARS